jgi:hypothetical protein
MAKDDFYLIRLPFENSFLREKAVDLVSTWVKMLVDGEVPAPGAFLEISVNLAIRNERDDSEIAALRRLER